MYVGTDNCLYSNGAKVATQNDIDDQQEVLEGEIVNAGNEVYILKEGETVDDAPDGVKEIIDPNAENGTIDFGQFAKKEDVNDLSQEIADKGVTPQMFGAAGDGETDDTAAINAALSSGSNVFFPAGVYKITSPLIMPSGIIISGASGLTSIKTYITDGYVLQSQSSTTITSINIENIKFENGNTADETTHLQSGKFIHTATGLYMRNCRVYKYYDVIYNMKGCSYIINCRFNSIYNSFVHHTTDSVIDGCYINSSRYGLAAKSKAFTGSFNSTTLTNSLIDYFYSVFAVTTSESGTVTGNTFNRCVNVFHDTLSHITVTGNIFTQMRSSAVDLSVLTTEQIAELEAEKWSVIKFDNIVVNASNHVMGVVIFSNNFGYNCDYYIYIADGVKVIPADCEFRGNQISNGSKNGLSSVEAGFRNTISTESSYNSLKNCFFDFWDMKEYDTLPNAALYGDGAKLVKSFPYMKAVYGGEIYTNMNGVWVKEGQASQGSNTSNDSQPCISFVNDVSNCIDKNKLYVLPDGALYSYTRNETVTDEVTPKFTNLKDRCTYRYKERYSLSGGAFKSTGADTAVIVPVPSGVTSLVIRFKGVTRSSNYTNIYAGTAIDAFTEESGSWLTESVFENDVYTVTLTKGADSTYMCFHFLAIQESEFADFIVTINEPIEYASAGETIITEGFTNTGFALVKSNNVS